ncbi:MAG: RIP metalloprotease RseP [Chitinophagales bacterium]|nr:RIP metalloprotease RseP [Chitinophagales bacterium]
MTFVQVAQFLVSLSLLIILHEMGHFFPARWFKTRVEKFYLFFDPFFSLFKKKIGDTEYGIGWLPLGGYVKISGMMDESMDKEQMNQPPQPWEFRAKKTWQRLIIMIGGVTVNLVLAIIIFSGMLFHYGESYLPTKNATLGIHIQDSVGYKLGFKEGDVLIGTNQREFSGFQDFYKTLIIDQPNTVRVLRNGKEMDVALPDKHLRRLGKDIRNKSVFSNRIPCVVENVVKESAADSIGLKKGDIIVQLGETKVSYFHDVAENISIYKGKKVNLSILRGVDTLHFEPLVDSKGKLGFGVKSDAQLFSVVEKKYAFFEAIKGGVVKTFTTIGDQIKVFGKLFQGKMKAQDTMGGFGSIMSAFDADTWDWRSFWGLTAMLSAVLAFMNILPIPALDGGHVLFLIYEMIFRKAPSEKFMTYAQIGGMIFLFSLIIFVNGLDVFRAEWFQKILHVFSGGK